MYYFCAICMINTETLLDLNPKCRRLFEAMVSPYIEFKEGLKSCRILLCRDCNQVLGTMLKFQQTVVKGVMNLVALQKRSKMIYHNLPEVISAHTDLLLPVVNEEYVLTTNSIPVEAEDSSGGNYKNKKTVVRVSELSKPSKRNLPKKLSPPPSKLRKRRSETKKTPIKRKRQRKAENAESVEDLDTTLSGDSDCYFSGNLDTEPGYERLVAKSQMDHDYFNNKNDMAVLVPINNTRDKIDSTNTNESSEVKKTKLNRQLYQAIKLALESRSISDFDIAQYEPESESDFDHNIESHHDLTSPHDDLKSPQHDLKSPQHNAKSLHDSPNHDSKSSYLEKNSLHHDLKSAQETNSLHHDPKSPDLETNSPDLETNSLHHHSKSASYLEINSLHHDPKSPDLKTNSIYHHSKSAHHDTKSPDLDSSSHHVLESSDPDSESTVSCESDYEDAEHFPNIMLAKAFSGVADGRGVAEGSGVSEGSAVSEGVQKKAHLVLNPPSEWPCTGDSCHGHTHSEGHSSDSDVIADEDTGSNVKRSGKRRRKECKLCEKTFVSLYALWEHYEREHVDICRKECCNGTMMKNGNTRRLLQVPDVPEPQKSQYNCAECGIDCRNKTQMALHVATLRHKLRSQWRFQCDTCKRKFLDKTQVAEHIEREHLAKAACPICAATFHSERAMRRHAAAHVLAHAHAQAHSQEHAHAQAQGTRKRARKQTDTEKTPVSRNALDTATPDTAALSNRRVKRKRKRHPWTKRRKRLARNSDTQTNLQWTRKQTQGTLKRTQGTRPREQLADSDTHTSVQWIRKRTQVSQPRKQLAIDSGAHTNVQGTQEQSHVQLARNSDTHTNGVQRTRKRMHWTQRRKQLATDSDTHTNVLGTQEETQGTQSRVQLARKTDTHPNGVQGTRKRTQGPRKQLAPDSDTHTLGTHEETQGTQSRTQVAPDTHTNGVPRTQTQTQGPRRRTQTVGDLRKMQMIKERTQVENERVVNFYLNKFTSFEAGGGLSTLTYPPKDQNSPSQL